MDLLTYLQNYEPDKLVRVSGSTYCTREHDSLRISNGMWNWFSHQMGGRSALDYLVKVEGYSLPEAVERILGHAAVYTPVIHSTPPKKEKRLELPEMNDSTEQVEAYLRGRGIHPVIIGYCLELAFSWSPESTTMRCSLAATSVVNRNMQPCVEPMASSREKLLAVISGIPFPSQTIQIQTPCICLSRPLT